MFELLFEVIIGQYYEGLRALGLPRWAAVTVMVIMFGALIGCAIYYAWGW